MPAGLLGTLAGFANNTISNYNLMQYISANAAANAFALHYFAIYGKLPAANATKTYSRLLRLADAVIDAPYTAQSGLDESE